MRLKQTQMPLTQIREYARLYKEGEHTTIPRLNLLEDHRNAVQNQIMNLVGWQTKLV